MAIEQKNTYVPGSNNDLTNAVANIDINRTGEDLVSVEYSAPNFLIKVGSLIEANGNMYAVTTADESITAADGNLIFNESTGFAINNVDTPVYDPAKGGYYVNSTERVTKFRFTSDGDILEKGKTELPGSNAYKKSSVSFTTDGTVSGSNLFLYLEDLFKLHGISIGEIIPCNIPASGMIEGAQNGTSVGVLNWSDSLSGATNDINESIFSSIEYTSASRITLRGMAIFANGTLGWYGMVRGYMYIESSLSGTIRCSGSVTLLPSDSFDLIT
jgi:hypothetical protein